MEARFRKEGLRVLGRLFEALIHSNPLRLPTGAPCLHCGIGSLAPNGYRNKLVATTMGTITLRRAHYVCARSECSHGTYPLDLKLGLGRGRASPELHQVQMELSQAMSFAPAAKLLRELLGGSISARQLSRKTLLEGTAMEADRQAREPTPPSTIKPATYCAIDGGAAPMKPSQVDGRRGRSSDGKARSREAKLLSFHQAKKEQSGTFRSHDKTLCGAIESAATPGTSLEPSPFAKRLLWRARQSGFDQAKEQVVVGDGAAWIWNVVAEVFPKAHQILELYHVRDRLNQVSTARWGTHATRSAARRAWVRTRFKAVKKGRWQRVVKELEQWSECTVAQDCIRYFVNQQERMNYPYYRRQGWCCSSAVIESACKKILGGRLKGSGRRWNVDGANAMITLRCAFANGEENVLYEKRQRDNILKLDRLRKVPRPKTALPLAA